MAGTQIVKRFGDHQNCFGFIRLALAVAVIVGHTPELVDGDRHREPLTALFGTLSLGEVAVDAFFVISGYLITGSFLQDPRVAAYLRKRVVRIYPAFVVASAICVLIVAPLGGAGWFDIVRSIPAAAIRATTLLPPKVSGTFQGTPHPFLNHASWTIAYEFRCYLLVIILGLSGWLRRPAILIAGALSALTIANLDASAFAFADRLKPLFGDGPSIFRFIGVFLIGAVFYARREKLAFGTITCAAAAVALIVGLSKPLLAHASVAIFGGYLIFALAAKIKSGPLVRVNNREDISYGVYLYAWPICKLILWFKPDLSVWVVSTVTIVAAAIAGNLSWYLLEKPIMRRFGKTSFAANVKRTDAATARLT